MNIKILCVGKIKEPYLRKGIDYYLKEIGRYDRIEIIEVEDEKTPDQASEKMERQIRETEGKRLLKYIPDYSKVIALCIEGKMMTTAKLAKQIRQYKDAGCENLIFLIGGSLGLADFLVKRADLKLSFSAMTFPHQMMRMILLEQIYRLEKTA